MSDEFRKNLIGPEPTLLPAETEVYEWAWRPDQVQRSKLEKFPLSPVHRTPVYKAHFFHGASPLKGCEGS